MENKEMKESKEEKIEEACKRLKQAKENGYHVQAFLAEADLQRLLC